MSMPHRPPLADQSNASRTLEMQHRFARCDADWAEEAIAAIRKGESGDELGRGWGKGKVATRLGKVLTTRLPSPASRGDAWASAIKDTARWTGVPRIAPTKVFLDTGDFRMLNAATVCLRNIQMRFAAGGSLP